MRPDLFDSKYFKPTLEYLNNTFSDANSPIQVDELFYIHDIVFLLQTRKNIFYFNTRFPETIHHLRALNTHSVLPTTLFTNWRTDTILIIGFKSFTSSDSEMVVFRIPPESLWNFINDPRKELLVETLFTQEHYVYPSFFELDDLNRILVMKNSTNQVNVRDLDSLKLKFTISDMNLVDIRRSKGCLVKIRADFEQAKLDLDYYSTTTGKVENKFSIQLFSELNLELFEIFDFAVLIKQEGKKAIWTDMIKNTVKEIKCINRIKDLEIVTVPLKNLIVLKQPSKVVFMNYLGDVLHIDVFVEEIFLKKNLFLDHEFILVYSDRRKQFLSREASEFSKTKEHEIDFGLSSIKRNFESSNRFESNMFGENFNELFNSGDAIQGEFKLFNIAKPFFGEEVTYINSGESPLKDLSMIDNQPVVAILFSVNARAILVLTSAGNLMRFNL